MNDGAVEVMIVAAEASSAHYALRLLQHWRERKVAVKAFGVGTKAMEDLGFERIGKAEEMAVVGLAEVIEQYSALKQIFNNLVKAATERRPKVIVLLDYPDFNLMLAKKLRALGLRVVYYIAPQVWAWRSGRVHKIKKYCDRVLVVFPFEKAFYENVGMPADFVGHPILDDIDPKYLTLEYQDFKRQRLGFSKTDAVVGLMPGSRKGELHFNLPIQLEAASLLHKKLPSVRFMLLVAPTFTKEQVQTAIEEFEQKQGRGLSFPYSLVQDEPFEMICMVDVMMAASGTATLMVGLLRKPMVIMYKVKTITYVIGKMLVRNISLYGLPNLILGREVVPEKIQTSGEVLMEATLKYLTDESYRHSVEAELATLEHKLGDRGATARVAKIIESYF